MCLPGTIESVHDRRADSHAPRFGRRAAIGAAAGAALAAALPDAAIASTMPANRLADLTHVFSPAFPQFLGTPVTNSRETIVTVEANGFYVQKWTFWEHTATHLDVPGHFVSGGRLSPAITAGELIVPAVVIDISARAAADADATVLPGDLVAFERRHGRIPRGAVVCMHSGWESRAANATAYRNVGADGLQHFPGFSQAAVEWLLERRDITGVGVDTLSLDHGRSTTFDVHLTLLGADRYGIENLRNLTTIPPRGATLFVGLVPWEEGSGGPCRVIARW